MSDDLISRQAAMASAYFHGETATWDNPMPNGVDAVDVSDLEALPSVHPEQKAGRWEHDGGKFANRWICSQCGYKFYFEKSEAKYCPNCGAKMESEE